MPERYEVKITNHAEEALREIAWYIAFELLAPDTAISYVKELRRSIETLSSMPQRIPLAREEPWGENGVHQMVANNFYVYFWIDDENHKVQITDVIYYRRDQGEALKKMPMQ